ncbi:MAG TPA: FAD-dependent oxidoreductase, partial [Solirubrobacteraceae bacterium]
MHEAETQVAVVGAGAAGLYTALRVARQGARVVLISATPLAESSSWWAQGGLAAALAPGDSPARHLADTITAGRGSVRESAARVLCEQAPAAVADLTALGVQFDADRDGHFVLGLEGGHSARRVVHAGGAATGRRIIGQLSALVAENEQIDVLERRRATRVLTHDGRAVGVELDHGQQLRSRAIVLATG